MSPKLTLKMEKPLLLSAKSIQQHFSVILSKTNTL